MLNSKTKFDKRLEKIKHKRHLGVNEDSKDSDDDENDEETLKQQALFKEYMTEVVSALVFYANPNADLTAAISAVEQVSEKAMKFENALYKVSNLFD